MNLKNARFENDPAPLHPDTSPSVRPFSRAYLRHLFKAGEILAMRLLSLHNLHFYLGLMEQARAAIEADRFAEFARETIARYEAKRLG